MKELERGRGRIDVLGIGNAIVDVVAYAEDALVARLGLARGTMTLVDEEQIELLYRRMGPAREVSGGSCANTMAALASLGAGAAYIGRVKDDALGRVFAHDIRAAGVIFESEPAAEGPVTARCLIFVTPDAQRTMQTYLGACVELGPENVDEDSRRPRRHHLSRGLSLGPPRGQGRVPQGGGDLPSPRRPAGAHPLRPLLRRPVAGGVPRARRAAGGHTFRERGRDHLALRDRNFDEALQQVRRDVHFAALTRGARGSVVVRGDEVHVIDAVPPREVLDTTGAGDLYAAGFLRGLTARLDLAACGRLGSLCAAEIIGEYGARPAQPLAPLVEMARRPA